MRSLMGAGGGRVAGGPGLAGGVAGTARAALSDAGGSRWCRPVRGGGRRALGGKCAVPAANGQRGKPGVRAVHGEPGR